MAFEAQREADELGGQERRTILKNLAKELKGTRPDTSGAPPNITEAQMAEEVSDRQKNVERNLSGFRSYVQQQGWRTHLERTGTRYRLIWWHHSEGQGEAGDQMPAEMAKQSVGERAEKIVAENVVLKAKIEALTRALDKERNKRREPAAEDAAPLAVEEPPVVVEGEAGGES